MRTRKLNIHGDTIIEVMLAMALLTAFLFIAWGITNRSTQIGINSRTRTDMVNAMKEQAEVLKAEYVKADYKTDTIISDPSLLPSESDAINVDVCSNKPISDQAVFYYNGVDKVFGDYKQIPDSENTVWIQYVPDSDTNPEYHDFYIRACWKTVGSVQNTDHSQFVVRLNTNE